MLLLRSASLALSTRFNMLQQQGNCIRAAAFYLVPARADIRYGGVAGLFSFNMFEKIVLAAGRMCAATLKTRRSMGLCCFKMPSKVLLELERPVTL